MKISKNVNTFLKYIFTIFRQIQKSNIYWRDQNYSEYILKSMFAMYGVNMFDKVITPHRFHMKTFFFKQKPQKYATGTVHYENPLANKFVQIDQYGCLAVVQNDNNSNLKNEVVGAHNDQKKDTSKCDLISRRSTAEGTQIHEKQHQMACNKPLEMVQELRIQQKPKKLYKNKMIAKSKQLKSKVMNGNKKQYAKMVTRRTAQSNKRMTRNSQKIRK